MPGHLGITTVVMLVMSAAQSAAGANCSACQLKHINIALCGAFEGVKATILAFEFSANWIPRLHEFRECTGGEVRVVYNDGVGDGEDQMEHDLGADVGIRYDVEGGAVFERRAAAIYDGYIVQSIWLAAVYPGLDNLSPRIAETPEIAWNDVNAGSRDIITFSSGIPALPLDTDYVSFGYRQDLLDKHGLQPPQTLQEMVKQSEFFNGKDHNGDGVPDWGFCLTAQPNYFYVFVAPFLQQSTRECTRSGLCTGAKTGQNMFFDVETFEPLTNNSGFR